MRGRRLHHHDLRLGLGRRVPLGLHGVDRAIQLARRRDPEVVEPRPIDLGEERLLLGHLAAHGRRGDLLPELVEDVDHDVTRLVVPMDDGGEHARVPAQNHAIPVGAILVGKAHLVGDRHVGQELARARTLAVEPALAVRVDLGIGRGLGFAPGAVDQAERSERRDEQAQSPAERMGRERMAAECGHGV